MLHKLHPVSWSAAAKNDASVASRAHMHTPTSSSINSRFTQHMCVPLCWKRHALIPNHARAAPTKKCDIPSTPLPWQCLPCESADPCFMAAGSTQNAYTTRPLSPEDETMIQALHDKWGSSFQFKVCSDLQGTKQSRISY